MRGFDLLTKVCNRLADLIAGRQPNSEFVCGECERWQRCGLPPSNACIVRAEQIVRRRSAARAS